MGSPAKLGLFIVYCARNIHLVLYTSSQRLVQFKTCQLIDVFKLLKYFYMIMISILIYYLFCSTSSKKIYELAEIKKLVKTHLIEEFRDKRARKRYK